MRFVLVQNTFVLQNGSVFPGYRPWCAQFTTIVTWRHSFRPPQGCPFEFPFHPAVVLACGLPSEHCLRPSFRLCREPCAIAKPLDSESKSKWASVVEMWSHMYSSASICVPKHAASYWWTEQATRWMVLGVRQSCPADFGSNLSPESLSNTEHVSQ